MDEEFYLIYCDTDSQGKILNPFLAGTKVTPSKQYDHFFYKAVTEVDIEYLYDKYKVDNGELVLKGV